MIRLMMFFGLILLSACSSSGGQSGLVDALNSATNTSTKLPLKIDNPKDAKVIIWMHGTTRAQLRENCKRSYNRVPNSILKLGKNDNTYIYYLCSKATDGGRAGSYIGKRVAELKQTLAKFSALGVPANRIYIAGHSAGGWTALMAMRTLKSKFNAAIVFAPACCGPKHESEKFPHWLNEIQPRQAAQIASAPNVKALVFAYGDDSFNQPQDLAFLKKSHPSSVKMIAYSCGAGHRTIFRDCRASQTEALIKNYVGL